MRISYDFACCVIPLLLGYMYMRISIEWFLIDNWLMNYVTLLLASAFSGLRLRYVLSLALALFAAIYALIALSAFNILLYAPFRILVGLFLALSLRFFNWREYIRAAVCVLLSAAVIGGLCFLLSYMFTGSLGSAGVTGGVLIGTVNIRIMLLTVLTVLMLPRLVRYLTSSVKAEGQTLRLDLNILGNKINALAFVDSGNMLIEPVSGLPVVFLRDCPKIENGYTLRFSSMSGTGEITCVRAKSAKLELNGEWHTIDIMAARAPYPIRGATAIIGSIALPINAHSKNIEL